MMTQNTLRVGGLGGRLTAFRDDTSVFKRENNREVVETSPFFFGVSQCLGHPPNFDSLNVPRWFDSAPAGVV